MQHRLAWNWTDLTWCTVSSDTLSVAPAQQSKHAVRLWWRHQTSKRDCRNFHCSITQWRHLLSTVTVMFVVLLVGILQGVEHPWSFYSITPQWWHLIVLQYVAASFHLPSVSTANINTVQYTKPYQQYEIPTVPAVVISKVLLLQSNIMAAFVRSHSNLFTAVSPGLPT